MHIRSRPCRLKRTRLRLDNKRVPTLPEPTTEPQWRHVGYLRCFGVTGHDTYLRLLADPQGDSLNLSTQRQRRALEVSFQRIASSLPLRLTIDAAVSNRVA